MTIDYTYTCKMQLIFDNHLTMEMTGSLTDATNRIKWAFMQYPFNQAIAVSTDTGEILIIAEND